MTKYRRLELEELQELEQEFIQFLAANSVPAEDWKKWQKKGSEKVDTFIDEFSDIVLDKVLSKIEYVERRMPKTLMLYKCLQEEIILIGIEVDEDSKIDFTDEAIFTDFANIMKNDETIKIGRSSDKYESERNLEIFKMLNWGAHISDGKLFESIKEFRSGLLN